MALLIAFVLALGSSVAIASPAAANAPGSISGSVFGEGGGVISPSWVLVRSVPDGAYQTSIPVDAAGNFSFTDLPPGQYLLHFQVASGWIEEWWADQPTLSTAVPINVGDGEAVAGIAAMLAPDLSPPPPVEPTTASLSGAVLGNGEPDMPVDAFVTIRLQPDGAYQTSVRTDSAGNYTFQNLPAGDYVLYFYTASPAWTPEWWRDKSSLSSAESISVSVGQAVVDINALLEVANPAGTSSISGTLTGAGTPDIPMGNSTVLLLGLDGSAVAEVATNASGNYTISGVAAGSYTMRFSASNNIHRQVWWQHANTLATATTLIVPDATSLTGIDARLDIGASISGTVTTTDGNPVANDTEVDLWSVDGTPILSAHTTALGRYIFPTLLPGTYLLQFSASDGDAYVSEWWDNEPARANANVVTVAQGQAVDGINAELLSGPNAPPPPTSARLTGTVTGAGVGPLSGALVSLGSLGAPYISLNTNTAADGSYSIDNIPPGSYVLYFGGNVDYLSEYWEDGFNLEAATLLTVSAGSNLSGFDAVLSVDPGPPVYEPSSLSGTVTAGGGVVAGVSVELYYTTGVLAATTITGAAGEYSFTDLGNFSYTMHFVPADGTLGAEWWQDKPQRIAADYFQLQWGENRTGMDALLAPPVFSSVSGTLTDQSTGLPIAEVIVWLMDPVSGAGTQDLTNAAGAYTLEGIIEGVYRLAFAPQYDRHVYEYWNDATKPIDADLLTVGVGQTLSGFDAALAPVATIGGTVTDSAGNTQAGIPVQIYKSDGTFANMTNTDASGQYSAGGLRAGQYAVQFGGYIGDGYVTEWWNNASKLAAASLVTVAAGQHTGGIDAVLSRGASISGTVRGFPSVPLDSVMVVPVDSRGEQLNEVLTDDQGNYALNELAPGTYTLRFISQAGNWAPVTLAAVTVMANQVRTGVDATLPVGGSIAGTVGPIEASADYVTATAVPVVAGAPATVQVTNGSYVLEGLAPGDYTVRFDTQASDFAPEVWNSAGGGGPADIITVGAGQAVTGKNALLELGSSITGVVSAESGEAIYRHGIAAESVDGLWVRTAADYYSAGLSDGQYELRGLADGDYRIFFEGTPSSASEWWNDQRTRDTATLISVRGGELVDHVDVVLSRGGFISGTVRSDDVRGTVLADNAIVQLRTVAGQLVSEDHSDTNGDYRFQHIPAGDYLLHFTAKDHFAAWWRDASSQANAEPITFTGLGELLLPDMVLTNSLAPEDPGPEDNTPTGESVLVYPLDEMGSQVALIGFESVTSPGFTSASISSVGPTPSGFALLGGPQGQYYNIATTATFVGRVLVCLPFSNAIGLTEEDLNQIAVYHYTGGAWVATAPAIFQAGVICGVTYSFSPFVLGLPEDPQPEDNTAPGEGILVYPEDAFGNQLGLIYFENVTAPGYTSITPSAVGPLPSGFALLGGTEGLFYNVATTATFVGVVVVCLPFDTAGLTEAEQSQIALYHFTGGSWVATEPVPYGQGYACGITDSFSPFALGVPLKEFTQSSVPTISGTRTVGATLTANRRTWDPVLTSGDFAYQWSRDGVAIAGATSTSYALAASDAGSRITVTASATKFGYVTRSETSVQTGFITGGVWVQTGIPTVSGTPAVGQYLFADPGAWTPEATTLRYQWYRASDGTTTNPSSSPRYTVRAADAGSQVYAIVTASKPGFPVATAQSAPFVLESVLTTAKPTISGTPLGVGSTLTANPGAWGPAGVEFAYEWLRNGLPIDGEVAAEYLLSIADAGQLVSVSVTGSLVGYTTDTRVSSARTILKQLDSPPPPSISGTLAVGQTIAADAGTWGPGTVTLRYQWYRNGDPIGGPRSTNTYTVATADAGQELTVKVTGTQPTFSPATSAVSAPVSVEQLLTTSTPTIAGTPLAVGSTLTAVANWSPVPVTYTYEWNRGGAPIEGAQAATYLLVTADAGQSITVTVTGSRPGFTSVTRTSNARVIQSLLDAPPVPTVTGIAAVGQVLTAVPGEWGPGTVTLKYQWLSDGVPTGRNSENYTAKSTDAGNSITVTVTGSQSGFTSRSVISEPTIMESLLASGTPVITGTPLAVGTTLVVDPGTWGPAPVELVYQWIRAGVPIAGATNPAYTLVVADAGLAVGVIVSGTKSGYTTAQRTASKTIQSIFLTVPQPSIAGNATVGQTLTVVTGAWDPVPSKFTYTWRRGSITVGSSSTYVVKAADRGQTLTLTVSGTKSGFTKATSLPSAGLPVP